MFFKNTHGKIYIINILFCVHQTYTMSTLTIDLMRQNMIPPACKQ